MTRGTFSYIKCAECGHTYERMASSVDFVAGRAESRGWDVKEDRDDGRDICPECAEREGDT